MTEKELRAELKAGKLRPAYFFCGDEEYLKRAARRTLRQTVLPGEEYISFNYTRRSFSDTAPAALGEELAALPLFADRRLVEYIDCDMRLFSGAPLEALAAVTARDELFESSVLCLIAPPGVIDFSNKKTAARLEDALQKTLGGRIAPVRFETPAPADLTRWVIRHVEHDGVSCTPELARSLIARSGKNMERLASETDKLSCFVLSHGRTEACAEDLDALSAADPELGAFALSNAILAGRTGDALEALAAAKRDREKPTAMLAAITASFSDLVTVRALAASGLSDEETARRAGMNAYKVRLYRISAMKVTAEMLERALLLCAETDGLLKSGVSGFAPVERLLCAIAEERRKEGQ